MSQGEKLNWNSGNGKRWYHSSHSLSYVPWKPEIILLHYFQEKQNIIEYFWFQKLVKRPINVKSKCHLRLLTRELLSPVRKSCSVWCIVSFAFYLVAFMRGNVLVEWHVHCFFKLEGFRRVWLDSRIFYVALCLSGSFSFVWRVRRASIKSFQNF
jgi:hypothetical protein